MASAHGFTVNYSFDGLTAISDATGNLVESRRSGSLGVWESGGLGVRRLRFCLASMDVGSGFDERSITKTELVQFAAGTQNTEDNCRNPDNRNDYNVTSTLFDRGFTGHACPEQSRREHLPTFGLINMNGRVYDPFLARFLSPDPFVQAPGNNQNFNRYSYCVNNPLKYTDPSGEIFGTVFTFLWDLGATIFTKGGIDPWNTSENRREAWMEFDPTAPWSKTNKALKIDQGLGKTDPNRNEVEKLLQFFSRFTWELPQTLLGNVISHTRNVSGRVENVDYYGGATLVNMKDNSREKWGFSLGPYINSKNMVADPYTDDTFRHEYGHTLQSQLVGPYYLTHVALPSLIGQGLDDIGWADHKREWYETQANRMSERYFRNRDPNALTALPWDDTRYPREYKPNWYWIFAHPPVPFLWLLLY